MKTYLEILTVNGTAWDIQFSFSHVAKPIEIITVNQIPAIYLKRTFKEDCRWACSNFLINAETKAEESSDESRFN